MAGLISTLKKNQWIWIFLFYPRLSPQLLLFSLPPFPLESKDVLLQYKHSVTLNYFLDSEPQATEWIVNLVPKLKIRLSSRYLRLVQISTQAEHCYFLRPAEYLQRKLEAQQYKLKVEKQLVSKIPNMKGNQEFPHSSSVHKYSRILKSKFIPHRWSRLSRPLP